jgi:hypothetical protein
MVSGGLLGVACLVGAGLVFVKASVLLTALTVCLLVAIVAIHPPVAAYLLIGLTPLVAGIDRGALSPFLRPNEVLLVLVALGLIVRGIARAADGRPLRVALDSTNVSVLVLAVAASMLPLAWMLLRGQTIAQDDVLYALIPWKYYAVFLVTLASVRTERQVRHCLWIGMIAASIVAALAILQALQLFGVARLLSTYFRPYGNEQALFNGRGGSTLSLPIAVADLMIFNLAIAVGFLTRRIGRPALLVALAMLFLAGALAAGEISGGIGLVIAIGVLALVTRQVKPLLLRLGPALLVSGYALRPVIQQRARGFHSVSGLPVSWTGRLSNLRNYFWPTLFSHGNFILGVRPAARVATRTVATGYTWIESGYTWLLWGGGIPLLGAFLYFVWTNLRRFTAPARSRSDAIGAAALGAVVALAVITVLMVFDPHLTFRGSADLLFSLLALASVGARVDRAAPASMQTMTDV